MMDIEEQKKTEEVNSKLNTTAIVLIVIRMILCIVLIVLGGFTIIISSFETNYVSSATTNIDSMHISAYNARYQIFEGDDMSAGDARTLINMINAHNSNLDEVDGYGKISLLFYGKNSGDDFIYNVNSDNSSINASKIRSLSRYTINMVASNSNGAVAVIRIIEKQPGDDTTRVIPAVNYSDYVDYAHFSYNNRTFNIPSKKSQSSVNYLLLFVGVAYIFVFTLYFIEGFILLIRRKYNTIHLTFEMMYMYALSVILIVLFGILSFEATTARAILPALILIAFAIIFVILLVIFTLSCIKYKKTLNLNNFSFVNFGLIIPIICSYIILAVSLLLSSNETVIVDKPIIYLYPEENTNLQVSLGYKDNITTSYPKYEGEGWKVRANPNGDLEDLDTGKKLYSLYWEGINNRINKDLKEGFVVKGEEVADFLDEKLEILGLNYKEREEFIVYWLPKLEKNRYNFIRFALNDECNEYMPLTISEINDNGTLDNAEVDTLIRVLMIFKPLNHEIKVNEQNLPRQERTGFTVIEWGGSEI